MRYKCNMPLALILPVIYLFQARYPVGAVILLTLFNGKNYLHPLPIKPVLK